MMKTVKFLLASLMLFAFTANVQAGSKQKKTAEVTFSVSMHCENCQQKVENTIPHEKGVLDMKTFLDKKEVWIKYNTQKTDKAKLQQALEKLGYTVAEVEPAAKK
jgi:copper chaperone CopZ